MPPIKSGTNFTNAKQSTHINPPGKLSIKELSSVEQISPAGKRLIENTPPRSGYDVEVAEAPAPVHMGSRSKPIGTEFTSQTTNHGPTPALPLMTEKSAAAAKRAAPRSAYKTNLEEK
jgi:hypothetical protein